MFGAQPDVLAVYLYGSAARGAPARDLDIAVLFDRPPDARILEPLARELQAQGAPGGPEIDLRPMNGAAPRYQATVLQEGLRLYERDRRARVSAEAQILSRWADFRPVWLASRRRMLERWTDG